MGELNFQDIFENVRTNPAMVHCITNYVTINDVANIILAMGASPIMADDPMEVCEITDMSDALVINMGTLKQNTVRSMLLAGKKANESRHPVVFDPVGVGASTFRKETAMKLLDEIRFSVIRGNISEIKTLHQWSEKSYGVDAKKDDIITKDNQEKVIRMAKDMAVKTGAVIVITGEADLVTDGETVYFIKNGAAQMARITGCGCMLDGVIAGFVGSNQENVLKAAATAVSAMGICGEYAQENAKGTGTFKVHLMDAMSNIDEKWMERSNQIESRS
nr:hydroxyethylthiazole kinase [uncultured Anaerostipes sp.]